jgi:catechol 2,3-dioxygenase-like lactoylglutathione lyase family enzyme
MVAVLDHLSIQVRDVAASAAFYDTVLAPLGGQRKLDFGAAVGLGAEVLHEPRVRPEYHPTYYGAYVRDPDGNNVEAVCHAP